MNLRRQKFVREYLRTGNASEAARRAGYSKNTAYSQGERLLRNDEVKAAVSEYQAKAQEKGVLDLVQAKRILSRIATAKLPDYFGKDGAKNLQAAGQEIQELTIGARGKKIKLRDPVAAIETLARLSGWYEPEKHSIEGSILVIE